MKYAVDADSHGAECHPPVAAGGSPADCNSMAPPTPTLRLPPSSLLSSLLPSVPPSLLLDSLSIFIPPALTPVPSLCATDRHIDATERGSRLSWGRHAAALTHSVYHSRERGTANDKRPVRACAPAALSQDFDLLDSSAHQSHARDRVTVLVVQNNIGVAFQERLAQH